jgi:hypothetical protein
MSEFRSIPTNLFTGPVSPGARSNRRDSQHDPSDPGRFLTRNAAILYIRILWRPRTKVKNIGEPHAPIKKVEAKYMAETSKENERFSHSFEAYLSQSRTRAILRANCECFRAPSSANRKLTKESQNKKQGKCRLALG